MTKNSKVTIKSNCTMEWEKANLNDLCEMLGYFVIMLGKECMLGGNSMDITLSNIRHSVDCGVSTIKEMYSDNTID